MIGLGLAGAAILESTWIQPPSTGRGTVAGYVNVEELPGIVVGAASPRQRAQNTRAINMALAAGSKLHLRSRTRIEIAGSLIVPSGGAIIGDGQADERPVIYMSASGFTNRDDRASRYGGNAVGINFSGSIDSGGSDAASANVRLENFVLESERAEGRFLRGIVGRNVRDCAIVDVEVLGLPTGVGIALASATRCTLSGVYIHDFGDSTNWTTHPQITGIEIDNDIVGALASSDVTIDRFRVENLRVSGSFLNRWGYQTDGINIAHNRSEVTIRSGHISRCGEGIDTFGSDGTIADVEIADSYIFGLKFIHGASRNRVNNLVIVNSGLAGITFSGSHLAGQDTARNVLTGIRISGVDHAGTFRDNSTAGILFTNDKRMKGKPRDNRVAGAFIDLGPNGKYGWLDTSGGSGNVGLELTIVGGPHSIRTQIQN